MKYVFVLVDIICNILVVVNVIEGESFIVNCFIGMDNFFWLR